MIKMLEADSKITFTDLVKDEAQYICSVLNSWKQEFAIEMMNFQIQSLDENDWNDQPKKRLNMISRYDKYDIPLSAIMPIRLKYIKIKENKNLFSD